MMKKIFTILFIFLFINFGFSQNGKILSKKIIDISKTPIWNSVSQNNELRSNFKYLNKLNFYLITYKSDNLKVSGVVIEPKKEGKYPVVIFNGGYNRVPMKSTIRKTIMSVSKLASAGYVVIGSSYREKDEFGGAEINDLLNLITTVKNIEKADSNCIGMFGWSRGGMTTYLALQKSKKIKTAIIGNATVDLFETIKFRPEMETEVFTECIPNYWKNKETELKKRSAIYWADELDKNSSVLIICGTNDKKVNPQQSERIAEKLKKINYNFEFKKFETNHFFHQKTTELNELVIKWFDKNLK
ncbi:alpha/beta hydrolase family protein [Tenacibaculum salmonis]|uniref:alpha/beta hydrolase family protein n=1 Tax=Tenacibaculum sp. P3-BQ1 TaxID=3232310 RepID=UPI0034DF7F7B